MTSVIEEVARALHGANTSGGFSGSRPPRKPGYAELQPFMADAEVALRALLSGPVGDVLRAALDAAGNAEPLPKAVLKAAEALPSEITDMLGGE